MRQGGLRPHSYKSGVYWTRATAGNNTPKKVVTYQERQKWPKWAKIVFSSFFILWYFIVLVTPPFIGVIPLIALTFCFGSLIYVVAKFF